MSHQGDGTQRGDAEIQGERVESRDRYCGEVIVTPSVARNIRAIEQKSGQRHCQAESRMPPKRTSEIPITVRTKAIDVDGRPAASSKEASSG